ncbi:hypothetical protein, partial [Nocardia sp. JCM 34519.1]|uniref:hypothetical protein n=2 Tax=unclassified Nocardia TaxID=2637762 RepID=UPI001CE448EA
MPVHGVEGRMVATSSRTEFRDGVPGAPRRVSFAKIAEPMAIPNLLAVQTESFAWLIGAPEWRAARGDVGLVGGLEEVLEELSPIEDFSGSMSLSFSDPRF